MLVIGANRLHALNCKVTNLVDTRFPTGGLALTPLGNICLLTDVDEKFGWLTISE